MSKPAFKVSQLIAFAKAVVGMPYWYGTCGYKCTESRLKGKAKQYPSHYSESRMPKYHSDIAKKYVCFDCIGLIKSFFWTNGGADLIRYIHREVSDYENKYASNNMPDKSANGMFSYCKSQGCENGKIDTLPDVPGILLFSDGHVGLYIGGGKAIEARGFNYGVVETSVKNRKWTKWAYMPENLIEYDTAANLDTPETKPNIAPQEPEVPTINNRVLGSRYLCSGLSGDDVAKMQELLNSIGFNCGEVDGKFGSKTEEGLEAFQKAHNLEVDGIYGKESHAKLTELTTVKAFKIQVTGGSVNVRTKPDIATGKVKYIVKAGRVLTSVGRDAKTGWYQLDDGNYISYKYIKEI